ncbi:MAG: NUDIX domain-containing protein [Phycisphaerae bacterium]|nr:NUDIX domain-containing protein [Phycisphaerae bacterium]
MKPYGLAVKAVIVDTSGRCLLLRRSEANRSFVGCWEWPGGKVDPGEHFADAVVRETREEIGLDVEITGFAGATEFEMPKTNVVLLCMEARITGGEIALSHEHDAHEWVALGDIGNRQLPPAIRDFMVAYAERKAGRS